MKTKIAAALGFSLLFLANTASAHRIDEYLQATVLALKANRVEASMRLIPGITIAPAVITSIDSNHDGSFSDQEQRIYAERVLADLSITLDGQSVRPRLIHWAFPQPAQMREGLGEIHVDYEVDVAKGGPTRSLTLVNRHWNRGSVYLVNVLVPDDSSIHILTQTRNEQQTLYELNYEQSAGATWSRPGGWVDGEQFRSLFRLGVRHISEGTDHLLFLLTLLLPAPLLIAAGRWGGPASARQSLLHILGIVTAFTIGHSITLMLAALGAVRVPGRPVEVLIAASIFVSALHALRPIVSGQEARIAGFFGLIHGLAFATTLDRLGFGLHERVAGTLAFNLGIEAMQLLVVAAILPSLILMSRTRAYSFLRVGGALFAGAASLAWMTERIFAIKTPVDMVVNAVAHRAVWIAVVGFLVSLACKLLLPSFAVSVPAPASTHLQKPSLV